MAYKDSGEIATNSNYALGDYSFRIERSSVPGSTNDKIEAICTDKDGKNARKSIQIRSSTQLNGWYVEANDDTATVYITVEEDETDPPENVQFRGTNLTYKETEIYFHYYSELTDIKTLRNALVIQTWTIDEFQLELTHGIAGFTVVWYKNGEEVFRSSNYGFTEGEYGVGWATFNLSSLYPPEKPVYAYFGPVNDPGYVRLLCMNSQAGTVKLETSKISKTILVARFEIDLEDAGGVGPGDGTGGGWTDPGDYDEDWEEGDPTHTLYVTVTGALSGRHNDPIVDPSYSYIPADKDTVKDYGCGGDGGHGGGGGAGASTVVIHKFATNQANSKEVTAIARRHGYGSGGGKGGKGGDGCILVYY